ncbi:hypothetical protein BH10PLA1_BH10PLA1_16490 [soil metagenome]
MTELVLGELPLNTPTERDALKRAKDAGFTSIQIYTQWRRFEPVARGQFDWAWIDRQVELIQNVGLKYVPFLLMGPYYAAPDWWLASADHVGMTCLEHGKVCPIESVWNSAFNREIARVCDAFSQHFLPWNVIESVQPGIGGDYGEAIFPVLGNWPGTYHTHRGYWCGGEDARAAYREYLLKHYGSLDALNRQWRTSHPSIAGVHPQMPGRCSSRSEMFDLLTWYRQSMTDYSELWMRECRRAFPKTPVYLCTGGADDETTSGAHFGQQAKIAAKHGGGIRLTNEANTFAYNYPLTSHTHAACEFYGAYFGLEPVGPITENGVSARMFGSAAFGNRQVFHYYKNLFDDENQPKSTLARFKQSSSLIHEQPSERGIAMFWPIDQATLNGAVTLHGGLGGDIAATLLHVRRQYPTSAISEELILDGILSRFKCLVMTNVSSTRAAVLERIADWVQTAGGTLITTTRTCDIELNTVPAFDALFGITPESEEAWGHQHQNMTLPPMFKKLSTLAGFHAERGWLHLAVGTELLGVAKPGIGSSGLPGHTKIHPVSSLFRRTFPSGGQAIFYGGGICFKSDAQALFADPEVIAKLLDDVCAATGVRPLNTRDDESARARIGGKLLVLKDSGIEVRDDASR